MSTRDLLNRLYARIHQMPLKNEWTRNTGSLSILKLIEKGQDALLDEAKQSQIWIGSDNKGFPPYLTTQKGIYRYDIIAANLSNVSALTQVIGGQVREVRAKQVQKVFIDVTHGCSDYGISYLSQSVPYHFHNPFTGSMTRLEIAPVPVQQYEALEGDPAYIEFQIDPLTTTDRYFVEFTWEAPRLLNDGIPLVIPSDYESAIEDFVIGIVLEYEPGVGINQFSQRFEQMWKPKFKIRKSSGAQNKTTQVIRRFC